MKREHGTVVLGVGVLAVSLLFAANGQDKHPDRPAAATAAQASFDQPLAWMDEARTRFAAVKDYSCILATRERIDGKIGERTYVQFKMLAQPFSVHMKWIAPYQCAGTEFAYIEGQNNGKLRVKTPPLRPSFVSIAVDEPRIMKISRYTVREAGIGKLIDRMIAAWDMERTLGKSIVSEPVDARMNGLPCVRLEVTRLARDERLEFSRSVIYLEKTSKLPIHVENYGWPADGACPGELMEEFSYYRIEWNTGLTESQFVK